MSRRRLVAELIRRGLVADAPAADVAIRADRVLVNGAVAANPDRLVSAGDAVVITTPPAFVSRGGDKLEHALESFAVDAAGRRWLDAGASTGGFTDCLLRHGAAHVIALDVGHGHLHPRLREDPAVTTLERVNVRHVSADMIGGLVDGVVADLSFISLRTVSGALVALCKPGATMVLLVKPQFEATRAEVSAGAGVIADPAIRERVRSEITADLQRQGCTVLGWTDSPVRGASGNRELFVHAVTPSTSGEGASASPDLAGLQ